LPGTVAAGQTVVLQVEYAGSFDPALQPDDDITLASINPEASYLLADARWFPQAENPWQRHTMKLTVSAPEGLSVISTGEVEGEPATNRGRTETTFSTKVPSRPGTLVLGKYDEIRDPNAPITHHLLTVSSTFASTNSELLTDIMVFFAEEFGELPNEEIAIVEIPDDGLEAYTAPGLLLLPVRHWQNQFNRRLLARHLAGQWWRVNTAPASTADIWLAEGLTRYSEALYIENVEGEAGFRQALEDMTIGALVDESAASIGNADRLTPYSPEFTSIVRDKGAMVFHMLRRVVGNENFSQLLRETSQRFAGRNLSIDQFERFAEQISGQPLDYFFGQWVRSTGIPQFTLEYIIFRTREGFRINGAIKNDLEIFRMPVKIQVETEGPPIEEIIEVAGTSSDFELKTFGKPTPPIQIDPDFDVLKFTPSLRLRVAIARGEAMFERGQYFEAIREYQNAIQLKRDSSLAHYRMGETFFEQRNYQSGANAFREALNGDRDPLWTAVWSRISLGKIFDITGQRERAVNEYRRALESKDNTGGAQAEARKYLREPFKRESREIERIDEIDKLPEIERRPVIKKTGEEKPAEEDEETDEEEEEEDDKPPAEN
jgi:tetratricopeptide (TPR) repeat protein